MKKNLLTATAFLLMAFAATAQKNVLKMNPASLLVKTGNVAYERALSRHTSAQLGAFYSGVGFDNFKYAGWGVTPELRYYFGGQKEVMNGAYVAPFARYQDFLIRDEDLKSEARISSIGGGAIVGWQRTSPSGFTVDLFAGPSFSRVHFSDANDEDHFELKGGLKGFGLRTGITLGFAF